MLSFYAFTSLVPSLFRVANDHRCSTAIALCAALLLFRTVSRPRRKQESWLSHVQPHDPPKQVGGPASPLYVVDSVMKYGMPRRMVVFRLPGHGLLIQSAVAVTEDVLQSLLCLGQPRVLVVPNSFHRLDAGVWAARFPDMTVCCPEGAKRAVAAAVPGVPLRSQGDLSVMYPRLIKSYPLPGWSSGAPFELATEFSLGSGTVAFVITDTLFNLAPRPGLGPRIAGAIFGNVSTDGLPKVSRIGRMMGNDLKEVGAFFRYLSTRTDIVAIVMGHGSVVEGVEACKIAFAHLADSLAR